MSGMESLHCANIYKHLSVAKGKGHVPPKPSQTRQPCVPSASACPVLILCQSDGPAVLPLEVLCTAGSA